MNNHRNVCLIIGVFITLWFCGNGCKENTNNEEDRHVTKESEREGFYSRSIKGKGNLKISWLKEPIPLWTQEILLPERNEDPEEIEIYNTTICAYKPFYKSLYLFDCKTGSEKLQMSFDISYCFKIDHNLMLLYGFKSPRCVDINSKTLKWEFYIEKDLINYYQQPFIDGDTLFFVATKKVYALNCISGDEKWSTPPFDRIYFSAQDKNTIFIYDSALYHISKNNGKIIKKITINTDLSTFGTTCFISSKYFLYFHSGNLQCYDIHSGELQWQKSNFGDLCSEKMTSNNNDYLFNFHSNKLMVYDLNSGNPVWSYSVDQNLFKEYGIDHIFIKDNICYVNYIKDGDRRDKSMLVVLDAQGQELWKIMPKGAYTQDAIISDDVLYLLATDYGSSFLQSFRIGEYK